MTEEMETYFSAASVAARKAAREAAEKAEQVEEAVAAWETARRVELAAMTGAIR